MEMIHQKNYKLVLNEINECLSRVANQEIEYIIDNILNSRQIILVGAGRMGLMLQSFCARLNHLGFPAFMAGTIGCPRIGEEDMLLVASSSGETSTTREIALIAHKIGAKVITITANTTSTIARISSGYLYLQAPSSLTCEKGNVLKSLQPMKTLFEQSLFILLESMVLYLLERTGQSTEDLARRHANLE
jgi:6-phospho-3-hexuloisomerase